MDYLYETITVTESVLTLPIPPTEYFNIGQGETELEELGTILADGGDRFGVSTVHFDPVEELLWMGNQGGHVTSYYGPEMQKYTSFQVHPDEPVRQIAFLSDGILCLTDTSLRYQLRRGIPKKTHRSKNMLSTHCMLSTSPDRLLIGGHQDQLIDFDLATFTETSNISLGIDGCAVLRSHCKYLCCGNAFGKISLRDPNTYNEEHVISTHSGSLSDFDVQGNYLISCGFSDGRHGKLIADRHLLVYDLRMHRLISPIYTSIDPFLLHFLPLHCQRLAVVSPLGQLQLVDTVELSKPRICMYQINTSGAQCLSFDISSTTQTMVFGDQAGKINLVGSIGLVQPKFNGYSRPTEFADPIQPLPFVQINEQSFPMASVPLPKLSSEQQKLSSDMPEDMMKFQHLQPKAVDAEILENMKMKGPIGYALNPKKTIRNIIPYYQHSLQNNDQVMTPINKAKTNHENGIKMIPKRYRKAEIKFSKVGTQDIDYDKYNQTDFIGLEAILPNAYCNPMLQVLYFISPLRKMLLSHACMREHCISCELGFLFHMFDISSPPNPPCQASNFLRVFRTVPEASALGLILSDRNTDNGHNLVSLIQNWNRFILHQIHNETMENNGKRRHTTSETLSTNSDNTDPSEISDVSSAVKVNGVQKRIRNFSGTDENHKSLTDNHPDNLEQERVEDESGISQLFGTKQDCVHRCLKCNEENIKSTIQMVCNLLYTPPKVGKDAGLTNGSEPSTFKKVLESSLCFDKTTPAWCETCKKFTPTNQRSKVKAMPNILALNTGLDNDRHLEYLRLITGHTISTPTNGISEMGAGASPTSGLTRPTNGILKQCRYGTHCSRIDCHFAHPERKSPSLNTNQLTSMINHTSNNNNTGNGKHEKLNTWFPLTFTLDVTADGQVVISKEVTAENTQMTTHCHTNGVSTKLEYLKIEESIKNPDVTEKGCTENGHDTTDKVTNDIDSEQKSENNEAPTTSKNYTLTAVVCHIDEGTHRNLVALINVEKAYHELKTINTSSAALPPDTRWYLFNDFTVSPVSVSEAVWFTFDWKIPTVCYYTSTETTTKDTANDLSDYQNPMTFELFKEPSAVTPETEDKDSVVCKPPTQPFPKGYLVAMDAEFVTLNQEENEIRADGKMSTIKPKLQNAARITCIHGQGPHEGQPFMDDYISTHEQVVDYLTKYSGIKPGDLDAHFSNKKLTTLKKSYQKLRYLVDSGVIFVGHGLRNDFRVINMIVPSEQIVDTVYLFHIPHYRMISLRFLAWHFLGIKIQSETHDSIEDARTALLLYKHYLHLKARNGLSLAISNLYEIGMQLMWKVPNN